MKKTITLIGVILTLMPLVQGLGYSSYCLDGDTLYEETLIYYYVNGTYQYNEKWNQTVECNLGCHAGVCTENSETSMVMPSVMYAGVLLLWFSLWKNADEDKFRAFFLILFYLHVLAGMVFTINYIEHSTTNYSLLLWSRFFILDGLMLFVLFVLLLVKMTERGKTMYMRFSNKVKSAFHD